MILHKNINSLSLTQTTCTGKLAEICQLSAVSENGRREFSTFILPQSNISYSAYLVHGTTIKNIKGVRTLCQGNNPVKSVTIERGLNRPTDQRTPTVFFARISDSERKFERIGGSCNCSGLRFSSIFWVRILDFACDKVRIVNLSDYQKCL